jgi:hypothetical protein
LIEAVAAALGVEPREDREAVAIGVEGAEGRVYSWAELVLAHITLMSPQGLERGANDR